MGNSFARCMNNEGREWSKATADHEEEHNEKAITVVIAETSVDEVVSAQNGADEKAVEFSEGSAQEKEDTIVAAESVPGDVDDAAAYVDQLAPAELAAQESVKELMSKKQGAGSAEGFAGYITKRGSAFPYSWKHRYCTFEASTKTMSYFESEERMNAGANAKGSLQLRAVRAVEDDELSLLFESADGKRRLLARVANAEERSSWMNAMQAISCAA